MNILLPSEVKLSGIDFFTDMLLYNNQLVYLNLENITILFVFLDNNESVLNILISVSKCQFNTIYKMLNFISKMGLYTYNITINFDMLYLNSDDLHLLKITVPLHHNYYNCPIVNIDDFKSSANLTIRLDIVKNIMKNDYRFRLLLTNINNQLLNINKICQIGKITISRDW